MGAALATLLLATGAFAQKTTKNLISASELTAADVKNLQNEDIGNIDDVLIDPSSGRVGFVALGRVDF